MPHQSATGRALTGLLIALCFGCATQEENQQLLGAGAGAAVGCAGGAAVKGKEGCITGGVLGAAVGWGVTAHYQASQVRSQQQDQKIYGVTKPVSATQVKIRKGSSTPKQVHPGDTVKVLTDYSLLIPAKISSVQVEESWVLMKDGKVLSTLPGQRSDRAAGGWMADASIKIPADAKPGTYVTEHRVKADSSYDTDESTFIVGS